MNQLKPTLALAISMIAIFIVCNPFESKGQTTYTGYFCTGPNQFGKLKYSREYKEDGDVFITLYKIYSPEHGYYLNITATHYKSERKIKVSVDDITVKIGGHLSDQEFIYTKPHLDWFGYQGSFKEAFDAQNVLPHQLALQFVSDKFENVKVVHVSKDTEMNATKWYVLDEEN